MANSGVRWMDALFIHVKSNATVECRQFKTLRPEYFSLLPEI
jgi:hypothetical protein